SVKASAAPVLPAERLLRFAWVLDAEADRPRALAHADHVRGAAAARALPGRRRGPREGAGLVGEADLEELAVARDAELRLLQGAAGARGALVRDDDVDHALAPERAAREGRDVHLGVPERRRDRRELARAIRHFD